MNPVPVCEVEATVLPLIRSVAIPVLSTRLLWEAIVDVGPRHDLGAFPLGQRFLVPITGGDFLGGPGNEQFYGTIRSGGADRQLLREDGIKELDAEYEMVVHSGEVVTIRNQAIIDAFDDGNRYCLSRILVQAPHGRWAGLNRRLIIGTVQPARPVREAVIVRAFEANATYSS